MNSLESEASLLLSILLAAPQTLGWQRNMIISTLKKVLNDRIGELAREWEDRLQYTTNPSELRQAKTYIRELREKLLG